MTTLEILRAARALIADPAHWCRVRMHDFDRETKISRHCAAGALSAVARGKGSPRSIGVAWRALDDAATELFRITVAASRKCPVAAVNDWRGHAAVLAVYDRAIAIEEAKAQEFAVPEAAELAHA